jgi:hypothetical protein
MAKQLAYTFLFFSVFAASAASAKPMSPSQCMHWCGSIEAPYAACKDLCYGKK